MTDKLFFSLFSAALSSPDRDAFVSDWSLSSVWGDTPDADIPADRIDLLARLWDAAHLTIRDIRQHTGLSQAAFATRYCIPTRTLEDWERGVRSCPDYLRLLLAQAILADPEVLVLVEPTSAVDAHTEARISERLAEHRRGRTTVVTTASPLLLHRAMESLIAGPKNKKLWPVLPVATQVRSVIVRDKVAQVDFSADLVAQKGGGSAREILAVSAIVYTLTEFPEVERVQILIEGKKVATLYGHMDLSEPLGRMAGLLKE